jgi:hypothetical protein
VCHCIFCKFRFDVFKHIQVADEGKSYNSAIFSTLAAQQFHATLVTEDFLSGGSIDTGIVSTENLIAYIPGLQQAVMANSSSKIFRRLERTECIRKYSGNFVTDVGDLLAVANPTVTFSMGGENGTIGAISTAAGAGGNSIYFTGYAPATYTTEQPRVIGSLGHLFVCADHVERDDSDNWSRGYTTRNCDVNALMDRPSSWRIGGARIAYCLSEVRQEQCKLQFSVAILWLVVASNFVKLVCMLWILFPLKEEETFVTLGDAVSSFLQRSDENTENQCLLMKEDVVKKRWKPGYSMPKGYVEGGKVRWFAAASRGRWAACVTLYVFEGCHPKLDGG